MEINIYAIVFLLSLIMIVILAVIGSKININNYILLFAAIMISNIGDYTISVAETLDMAIMGHRMVYLGGVFTPILMLFCTMKLCHMRIPKWLWAGLLALASVVLYFAFTVGSSTAYYTSLALGENNGMTILLKERGPMHSLYMLLLFGCIIVTFGVVIYSLIKKKDVSYDVSISLLMIVLITIVSYILERVIGTTMELVPFAYIIDEICFILLIRRIGKYEVTESIAASLSENSRNGYIIFNKKGQYIGANEAAKGFFPSLNDLRIDDYLSEEKTPVLYEKFGKRISSLQDGNYESLIEKDDMVLKCFLKTLHRSSMKKDGYVIELIDDTTQQTYMRLLDTYNTNLEKEVHKKTEHISMMQDKIVLSIADMIESRDLNTGGHVKRTSAVVRIFTDELRKRAKEYGFTEQFLINVAKAAPMHDLGKIAVDDRILRKPAKYTQEEFEEMQKHSEMGAEIVAHILEGVEDEEFVKVATNVAHYHHEKWNGEGYPEHLAGIEIPPEARIMALADVFDVLVSKRCYKEKMGYDEAFKIIEDSIGTHFDPELGKMFMHCRAKLEAYYDTME